ncbi:hypothetical protein Tco_0708690 [Tanacetum coccineum]
MESLCGPAIKSRFGGNVDNKKMHVSYMMMQNLEIFKSLPSSWINCSLDFDGTMLVLWDIFKLSDVALSSTERKTLARINNWMMQDVEQIDHDDLVDMELKMARSVGQLLSMRVKDFHKKKAEVESYSSNGKETVGLADMFLFSIGRLQQIKTSASVSQVDLKQKFSSLLEITSAFDVEFGQLANSPFADQVNGMTPSKIAQDLDDAISWVEAMLWTMLIRVQRFCEVWVIMHYYLANSTTRLNILTALLYARALSALMDPKSDSRLVQWTPRHHEGVLFHDSVLASERVLEKPIEPPLLGRSHIWKWVLAVRGIFVSEF